MKIATTVAIVLFTFSATAQLNPQPIQIPMRDGQSLAADLYLPSDQGQYPVVLIQTPYNKNTFRFFLPLNVGFNISQSPYAFVVLDWRCFYGSALACAPGPTRGEDGYDAVEWIASQSWCTGKVGTWGPSALGNVQYNTAREQPPHLACAVPMVASPQVRYHHYYPGGVVLAGYLETLGSLFGNAFALVGQNPYYNLIWQFTENSTFYPDEITIPMLHIGGWFDHNTEDVLIMFNAMRDISPAGDEQWLLMGPWTHGGTGPSAIGTSMQGELDFPEAMNTHNEISNAFFHYYLLEADNGWNLKKPVMYFQMGDNVWIDSETFPPTEAQNELTYYWKEDKSLASNAAGNLTNFSFSYDPEDPSPTVGGKTLSDELEQGPYDQSPEVESRDDNVIFSTEVLKEDVVVKGRIRTHFFVSSDRPDTDIALRLTEVYPDGRSIALGQIIQRMRFRTGYTMQDETFMQPGVVYEITMSFDHLAHTFQTGNRIRLIITSSNYPWFNRNMNTGAEMYPNGNLDTLVNPLVAQNAIHIQGAHLSRMILPVAQLPSAIHDEKFTEVELFPNPADIALTIRNAPIGAFIKVLNSEGRVIDILTIEDSAESISTVHYPSGVYFLQLQSGKLSSLKRFVVQH